MVRSSSLASVAIALVAGCTTAASDDQALPDARSGLTAAAEPCDKMTTISGFSYTYAEHAYPGKAVGDLASVTVRIKLLPNTASSIPGYTHQMALPSLRDGFAAILCNYVAKPTIDSVEFLGP